MKAGTLVLCIHGFESNIHYILAAYINRVPLPRIGQIFKVKKVERCECGKHDVLYLEGMADIPWNARNFIELYPPIIDETLADESEFEAVVINPEYLRSASK